MEPEHATQLKSRQQTSRDEVLDAAAEAFIERGYAATSIDDVADRLGCTKGRVYHYFRTKGELFLGVHHKALDMAIEAVGPTLDASLPAAERLYKMAEAHARLMMEETSYMRLAVQHAEMALAVEGRTPRRALSEVFGLRQQYESFFQSVISEGIDKGEFRKADPSLMAKACLGTLNWMSVWYRPGRSHTEAEVAEIAGEFAEFIIRGVSPAPAGDDRPKPTGRARKTSR